MSKTYRRKPQLPRAPLPRQTEKVHSERKKPLPPIELDDDYEPYEEPWVRPEDDPWDV